MEKAALIALLRPILVLLLYAFVVYWIARLLHRLIPEGRIKRFLFKRRGYQRGSGSSRDGL